MTGYGIAAPGARNVATHGYVRVKAPGHPEADAYGWAYEHRVVAHAAYGPIPVGYHVHHINGVRDDNRPENLEVVDPKAHGVEHRRIDRPLVLAMYAVGCSTLKIAARLGCDASQVSRILVAEGVPARKAAHNRVDVDDALLTELHKAPGANAARIAAVMGIGTGAVRRRMSELGLAPFPPGRPRAGWLIRSTTREDDQ